MEFGDEDVPAQSRDPERSRVKSLILLRDFFRDAIDEGVVDLSSPGIVQSLCVDGEAVSASEDIFENGRVWCVWSDVDHALESDIFI